MKKYFLIIKVVLREKRQEFEKNTKSYANDKWLSLWQKYAPNAKDLAFSQ